MVVADCHGVGLFHFGAIHRRVIANADCSFNREIAASRDLSWKSEIRKTGGVGSWHMLWSC